MNHLFKDVHVVVVVGWCQYQLYKDVMCYFALNQSALLSLYALWYAAAAAHFFSKRNTN